MRIQTGNVFTSDADAICVTTNGMLKNNGEAVMGAGIAKAAARLYRELPSLLGRALQQGGNHVYDLLTSGNMHILSFPTKNDWRNPSDIKLIEQSCIELVAYADKMHFQTVALPPVGCGCGGLDFETVVRPVIEKHLDDRFSIYFIN